MRRKSPSSAGISRRPRARRGASTRRSPRSGASGNSRRTRRQRRAWRFTCGKKSRSSNWSPPATATISRALGRCASSRPGPKKARPRAASGTTRRAARSSNRCRARPRPPTSPTRSIRRRRWRRWSRNAPSPEKRSTRRSTGRPASWKALSGPSAVQPLSRIAGEGLIARARALALFVAEFAEDFRGDHHRLADDRDADIAGEVQHHLDQLVLGPALAPRHAQVQFEFRLAAGAGVGNDADQRPRFVVEPGPGPEIAEDVLNRDIEEFLHYRVAVDTLPGGFDCGPAHQLPPLRHPLLVKLALRHLVLSSENRRRILPAGSVLVTPRENGTSRAKDEALALDSRLRGNDG